METPESGRIVIKDDIPSTELFSKDAALKALRFAFRENFIDNVERDIIEQQINDSPLPEKLSAVEKLLHLIKDDTEEIFNMFAEEFRSDTFSSEDGATPDDIAPPAPEGKILH